MSYAARTLAPREVILAEGRFHWTYSLISWLWLLLAGWALIGIAVFLSRQMRKWTTELVITNRRFIYKRGFISRHTDEFTASRIHAITLEQSLLERLFDCGRLNIRGEDIGDFGLPAIADPLAFRRALIESLDVDANASRQPLRCSSPTRPRHRPPPPRPSSRQPRVDPGLRPGMGEGRLASRDHAQASSPLAGEGGARGR